MSKTSFAVAAVVASAALTGGISAANAGGMHMHTSTNMPNSMSMHNSMPNHFFHHYPRFGIIVANTGVGCGYLYDRWIYTGDYYWKHRYEICRSDW